MKSTKFILVLILFPLVVCSARGSEKETKAQPATNILSFRLWKTQQIVDAQNQVARFANKSLLIKSSDPNKVVISNDGENLDELEKQLKQARIRLEVAQELSFDDYVSIYFSQYAKDKNSLTAFASKMSPQDVVEVLEYMSGKSNTISGNRPSEPVVTGTPSAPTNGTNL